MEINKYYDFSPLKDKWKMLYEKNEYLTPYQSDRYAQITYLHYLPYKMVLKARPVFYEVVDNNETIMIIPLCKNLFSKRYITFGYHATYGYIDFIYSKEIGEDRLEECLHLLEQELKGSELNLNRLRETSLLCQHLMKKYEPKATISCSHIDLPASYDEYFASINKKTRQHVRVAYRKLQEENKQVSLKLIYKQPLYDEELSKMIDLYAVRRKSRYGHNEGVIYKNFLKKYDICSVAMKQLDNCVHFILYIDDCQVAFCNGFISCDNHTITLHRLAIDIEYARFSPGILLLNESIIKICELGIAQRIDMIHGEERYKFEMGAEVHYSYDFDLKF